MYDIHVILSHSPGALALWVKMVLALRAEDSLP